MGNKQSSTNSNGVLWFEEEWGTDEKDESIEFFEKSDEYLKKILLEKQVVDDDDSDSFYNDIRQSLVEYGSKHHNFIKSKYYRFNHVHILVRYIGFYIDEVLKIKIMIRRMIRNRWN